MRRPLTWLGILATLTLLVAACGGDDSLSVEAYFGAFEEAADASEAQSSLVFGLLPDEGEAPDAETAAAFLDGLQALMADVRADMVALAAPSDLDATHDAFVAAVDAVIAAFVSAREKGDDIGTFFEGTAAARANLGRACIAMEQLAADRGVVITLGCAEVQSG